MEGGREGGGKNEMAHHGGGSGRKSWRACVGMVSLYLSWPLSPGSSKGREGGREGGRERGDKAKHVALIHERISNQS